MLSLCPLDTSRRTAFVRSAVSVLKCSLCCEQTSVMATDKIGLELLKKVGALDCHNNWMDNTRCVKDSKRQASKKNACATKCIPSCCRLQSLTRLARPTEIGVSAC